MKIKDRRKAAALVRFLLNLHYQQSGLPPEKWMAKKLDKTSKRGLLLK